jgi:hypothetical protein
MALLSGYKVNEDRSSLSSAIGLALIKYCINVKSLLPWAVPEVWHSELLGFGLFLLSGIRETRKH